MWSRMDSTSVTTCGASNCRRDTFTISRSPGHTSACHCRTCNAAVASTQRPIAWISPECSASGRNASGSSSPRSGCCQRTSASTPVAEPVTRSTSG